LDCGENRSPTLIVQQNHQPVSYQSCIELCVFGQRLMEKDQHCQNYNGDDAIRNDANGNDANGNDANGNDANGNNIDGADGNGDNSDGNN